MSALIYIIQWGGPHFYIYAWSFVFAFSLILTAIYPDYIAPLFDKFTELPKGELREAIEGLASEVCVCVVCVCVCVCMCVCVCKVLA